MPIENNRTPKDFVGALRRGYDEIRMKAVRTMSTIGDMAVDNAVAFGSYQDQTGNLRSSIGYVVVLDGNIVSEGGFNVIATGFRGREEGREYARTIAREYPNGLVLIVVAGMEYAVQVAEKGYNVLDSATVLAERLAKSLLK